MTPEPGPLTPPGCDLRGLPFIPLDVVRLLDSDLFALSSGDEFKAAVALWCKAWLQVPAASLPTDDRVLAHLSGAGPRWAKVRKMALHGWVLASDGRLYHPVVAEKAIEAWKHRLAQRERANKRWAKSDAKVSPNSDAGGAPAMPRHSAGNAICDAPASAAADATAMQGTGTGTGTGTVKKEPPSLREVPPYASAGADAPTDKRGTRLPPDWQPSADDRRFALQLGLNPDQVTAEFRDYWCALPGQKGRKLDWSATFRNRCREMGARRRTSSASAESNGERLLRELGLDDTRTTIDSDAIEVRPETLL